MAHKKANFHGSPLETGRIHGGRKPGASRIAMAEPGVAASYQSKSSGKVPPQKASAGAPKINGY